MTVAEQVRADMTSAMKAGEKDRVGASTPRDLGQVMKAVMASSGGRADGKRASASVREALS